MIFKFRYIFLLFAFLMMACSGPPEKPEIILSGMVTAGDAWSLPTTYDQPIFVFVAKGSDMDKIEDDPEDYIVAIASIDLTSYAFRINLTEKDVGVGDEVTLFAFADRDFKNGMPYPSTGDVVGIYYVQDKLSAAHVLKEGENSGLSIELNRDVFDFDSRVEGTVKDTLSGDLTVIAYAGEVTSSNTDALDYTSVIGYQFIENAQGDVPFGMEVLPYGFNLPIEKVYFFALLDVNRNNEADGGDKMGYYTISEDDFPTQVTISEELQTGYEIKFVMDLTDPSGYEISLSGNLILPEAADTETAPSYIFVAETDDPEVFSEDPASYIKYFEKIPAGQTSFDVDLSDTDLAPGDEIMIIALWDRDFNGGFPEPTLHDFIGFYMDTDAYAVTYTLKDGKNDGFELELNREVFDFDAKIQGTIKGSEAGDIILVAYAGEVTSFDMDALDYDKVVGFKEVTKGASPLDYSLSILPYGLDAPIEHVSIFALLDVNGNGKPDAGDRIGYHTGEEGGMPELITISPGTMENIDIEILVDIAKPSGYEMTVSGNLSFAENGTSPVYIIVAQTDDPSTLMTDPVSAIKYFEKLPEGATGYSISLESTDLIPTDEIIVVALQDKDNNGGFPNPTTNDYVGFFLDAEKFSLTYTLKDGENTGVDIDIEREVFDFESKVKGTINGNDTGNMMIVAYAGELSSLDFGALDFDKAVGYKECQKGAAPLSYTLDILPYGLDVPMSNVYIIAFLDKNGNGLPDAGDIIGFPVDPESNMPKLYTISEGTLTDVDIDMVFTIPEPSGYSMRVSGSFEIPGEYVNSTKPMFVVITRADDVEAIFNDPISSIKAFQKLPEGENSFDIDLSDTDLFPGDDIFIIAMWDKDYEGGLPSPSEGDYAGFYMNPSTFSISTTLAQGVNTVRPDGEYEFKINRKIYNHNASVTFELHSGGLPSSLDDDGDGEELDVGDKVIVAMVQKEGLNGGRAITSKNIDINVDYAIGMKTVEVNSENRYSISVLPALFEDMEIGNFIDDVYIIAILDENDNGIPDEGEYLGYYWYTPVVYLYLPQTVDLIDGENVLERSVRFSNIGY